MNKIDPAQLARAGTEHAHQVALFCWAGNERVTYPELEWLYAVPNGGLRNPAIAAQMKAEGLRSGVPDLFLPVAKHGFYGLYIELKLFKYLNYANGGRSDEQVKWHNALTSFGYAVITCYGWEHARDTLISYLRG